MIILYFSDNAMSRVEQVVVPLTCPARRRLPHPRDQSCLMQQVDCDVDRSFRFMWSAIPFSLLNIYHTVFEVCGSLEFSYILDNFHLGSAYDGFGDDDGLDDLAEQMGEDFGFGFGEEEGKFWAER
jgi:hypothetical protein